MSTKNVVKISIPEKGYNGEKFYPGRVIVPKKWWHSAFWNIGIVFDRYRRYPENRIALIIKDLERKVGVYEVFPEYVDAIINVSWCEYMTIRDGTELNPCLVTPIRKKKWDVARVVNSEDYGSLLLVQDIMTKTFHTIFNTVVSVCVRE